MYGRPRGNVKLNIAPKKITRQWKSTFRQIKREKQTPLPRVKAKTLHFPVLDLGEGAGRWGGGGCLIFPSIVAPNHLR